MAAIKVSWLEDVLVCPETYVGSVEFTDKTSMWIYDSTQEKIILRDIRYVPGLYKIFDEILVNAAEQCDNKMSLIKVDINKEKNEISVYNNGKGIPVAIHNEEKIYVPEMIFGTLPTSSNYNDDQKNVTGGRTGYGAKLCNIFSTKFTVETSSKEHKKSFKQTWVNNMTKDKDGEVGPAAADDFTRITFQPDLKRFKMNELDDDIIGLMSRRAYDVAGLIKCVTVYLNGKKIPVQGFKQYVNLYTKYNVDEGGEPLKVVYEIINDCWEIACTISEKDFRQVSFVNSIATTKGGTHVDYIVDQIVKNMMDKMKKASGKNLFRFKPLQVKNHIWVFMHCLIENPTFDSQTKEKMTLQANNFGSTVVVSKNFSSLLQQKIVIYMDLDWTAVIPYVVYANQFEEMSDYQSYTSAKSICEICSSAFTKYDDYTKHVKEHVEIHSVCRICEESEEFSLLKEFSKHASTHFREENNKHFCNFCNEKFVKSVSLRFFVQHLYFYCEKLQRCPICGQDIAENETLSEHRKQNHAMILHRFLCTECFLGFPAHEKRFKHQCELTIRCVCNLCVTFNSVNELIEHIKAVENPKNHGFLLPDQKSNCDLYILNPHSVCSANYEQNLKRILQEAKAKTGIWNVNTDHLKKKRCPKCQKSFSTKLFATHIPECKE